MLTVFPQPPALVVYLLVSFSIMALIYSFFLNVVSGAGVGASGSCSALVSVGQKLCKAGGIRQRIGSCSTCSEGLNTDFQMKSLLQCCVLFTCVPDVRELLSYKHFHWNVAFPGLKMLNVGFLLWCMSAESHHILKHRSQFLKD